MAYEKQTWQTGETITAQKLNHMEDGIFQSSSKSNDLVITTTYLDDDESFTISGHGLSIDEIGEKVKNGDDVTMKLVVRNILEGGVGGKYNVTYSFTSVASYKPESLESDEEVLDTLEFVYMVGANVITMEFTIESNTVRCEDWDVDAYEYSYNPTTKEYTFTEVDPLI